MYRSHKKNITDPLSAICRTVRVGFGGAQRSPARGAITAAQLLVIAAAAAAAARSRSARRSWPGRAAFGGDVMTAEGRSLGTAEDRSRSESVLPS